MKTTIRDRRTVELRDLPPGGLAYTEAGRVPIDCHSVEILYDIPTGNLRAVEVRGTLSDERDVRRRAAGFLTGSQEARMREARGTLVRRYRIDWTTHTANLPPWLADLVEEHRP